jgi:hypothetical protein
MWDACNSTVIQGLTLVRTWQKINAAGVPIINQVPRLELRSLMGTPNMRSDQNTRIDSKASIALTQAAAFAKERYGSAPSKRLFLWVFDIATQNGRLEGQSPKAVADFIAFNKQDKVDDIVCDYKGSIAMSGDWVNSSKRDFSDHGL